LSESRNENTGIKTNLFESEACSDPMGLRYKQVLLNHDVISTVMSGERPKSNNKEC